MYADEIAFQFMRDSHGAPLDYRHTEKIRTGGQRTF